MIVEDGHFIDDPLTVAGVEPEFSGMVLSKKIENAIIIGGKVYELIDDRDGDECLRCALTGNCDCINEPLCVMVFDDAKRKRFEERTDLKV